MGGFPAGVEEPFKQQKSHGGVIRSLRVPLYAEKVWMVWIGNRFDHSIWRSRNDFESPGITQGLPMMAGHHAFAQWSGNRMLASIPMIIGGGEVVGEVLVECSTTLEAHQLHAEADPENRLGRLFFEVFQQLKFECLTIGMDDPGLGMRGMAEFLHPGIISTAEDDAIQLRKKIGAGARDRSQKHRMPARPGDRRGVGGMKRESAVFNVGGDSDGGA